MKKGTAFLFGTLAALLAAVPAYADQARPQNFAEVIGIATKILYLATPMALVLLFFFWNMAQLIMTVNDPEKKKQARDRIIWSVVALFVLFSLGGIILIVQQTFFGTTAGGTP